MKNERVEFMRELQRLTASNLWTLVLLVGARTKVAEHVSVTEQVNQLFGWAESSDGCGLEELRETYGKLFGAPAAAGDPRRYLETLYERTGFINIRGLETGSGKAHRFPIDDIYIPLTTASLAEREMGRERPDEHAARRVSLDEALQHRRLVIVGDPGAGKTTFLMRVASRLCRAWLKRDPPAADGPPFGFPEQPLPVLIRLADFDEHVSKSHRRGEGPARHSVAWLTQYLAARSREEGTNLDERFFLHHLTKGTAILLLDGLDEAPNEQDRDRWMKFLEDAAAVFHTCRFVVTVRSAAYTGGAVSPGFQQVWVDALDDDAIKSFVTRFCGALFAGSPFLEQRHRDELLRAVWSQRRDDILRLARNPVMLTALAVVHWNEKRLPEQRWELYESIITWLSRSREERLGRLPAKRCVEVLQDLALAMQADPAGRKTQVTKRWGAERIQHRFGDVPEEQQIARAESFLSEEEVDSGIIVARGRELAFWHLTFQEYLAAKAIAGLPDHQQSALLFAANRLFDPNWREAILLLAGVLHGQGSEKAHQLFREIIAQVENPHARTRGVAGVLARVLNRWRPSATLADWARCAGLLGAALMDLSPAGYVPEKRFQHVKSQALGIFDRGRARSLPIELAIEAAEALGWTGDPRFRRPEPEENWLTIREGYFRMGAQSRDPAARNYDPDAFDNESPVHEVHLDEFRIGRYPVTVGEYQRFMEDSGYENATFWEAGGFGQYPEPAGWSDQIDHPNRPVWGVSWFEAAAYARWAGGRLPTEAEWERAARGVEGRKYPWGDSDPCPSLLSYEGNVGRPTPVGVYPRGATPEGICDLAGNVVEWCSDWYGKYTESQNHNPGGPERGEYRVVRGGGWRFAAPRCRGSYRLRLLPTIRHSGYSCGGVCCQDSLAKILFSFLFLPFFAAQRRKNFRGQTGCGPLSCSTRCGPQYTVRRQLSCDSR